MGIEQVSLRKNHDKVCPICYSPLARKYIIFGKKYCIYPECSYNKEKVIEVPVNKIKTPCEVLTSDFIDKFGPFPINRMWDLVARIRLGYKLTDEENMFIRVCIMQSHSNLRGSFWKDDDKCYEVTKNIPSVKYNFVDRMEEVCRCPMGYGGTGLRPGVTSGLCNVCHKPVNVTTACDTPTPPVDYSELKKNITEMLEKNREPQGLVLLPTGSTVEVYQYSEEILKGALALIQGKRL